MTNRYSSNRDGLAITTGNRAGLNVSSQSGSRFSTGNRPAKGGRLARARAAAKAASYIGSDAETTQRLLDK